MQGNACAGERRSARRRLQVDPPRLAIGADAGAAQFPTHFDEVVLEATLLQMPRHLVDTEALGNRRQVERQTPGLLDFSTTPHQPLPVATRAGVVMASWRGGARHPSDRSPTVHESPALGSKAPSLRPPPAARNRAPAQIPPAACATTGLPRGLYRLMSLPCCHGLICATTVSTGAGWRLAASHVSNSRAPLTFTHQVVPMVCPSGVCTTGPTPGVWRNLQRHDHAPCEFTAAALPAWWRAGAPLWAWPGCRRGRVAGASPRPAACSACGCGVNQYMPGLSRGCSPRPAHRP